MTEIAKPKSNTQVTQVDPVTFGITPISSSKINPQAVAIVNEFLPELEKKTKYFDRNAYYDESYNAEWTISNACNETSSC